MAEPKPTQPSNVNTIAAIVVVIGGILLLLGWILQFPW
jgi:hypothetical protein